MLDQIVLCEESGVGDTYDLEVDHPDHTFYANGISVSNSHAVSYGINSYLCAWLLTYYEAEWLCAYAESQCDNPDDKANAIMELRSFGYDVIEVDINQATEGWTILPGKKFMPSLSTCKGVGAAAIAEVEEKRPYKSIHDFLWNADGTWKHSKCNKKVVGNLLQVGAFDSFDCVGEGNVFASQKQMHDVLIENWTLLRKKLKKDDFMTQVQKLDDLIMAGPLEVVEPEEDSIRARENEALKLMGKRPKIIKAPRGAYPDDEWTKEEKIEKYYGLMGEINKKLVISPEWLEALDQKGYPAIDQFPEEGGIKMVWFVLVDYSARTSKSGKKWTSINAVGITGKIIRLYVWGEASDQLRNSKYSMYVAKIRQEDWGGYVVPVRKGLPEMRKLPSVPKAGAL